MNEFRLSGASYVSEWNGNDANAGTNPELPKKTINSVASGGVVVGAGYYTGNLTGSKTLVADGEVICDGLNNLVGNANAFYGTGIHFKNHLAQLGSTGNFAVFSECIFENCPRVNFRQGVTLGNVLLEGATFLPTNNNFVLNHSFVYENLNVASNVLNFQYCYLAKGKTFTLALANIGVLNNNMINGFVRVSGVDYELKFDADGNPRADANGAIADLIDIYPAVYTNGNFAGDAKILDKKKRIVSPDSDCFKRLNANGAIGKALAGGLLKKDGTQPNTFISTSQIDTSTENWEIAGGFSEGFIDIITRLSTNIIQVPRIIYVGLLDFAGTAPDNVPDFFPSSYTPLSLDGLRPNRLCFKMRSSRNLAQPLFDADWDNDSVILGTTAGVFYDHEWNKQPNITNVAGTRYGNANPLTIGGSPSTLSARWIHVRIRLTNLRAF